MDLFLRGRGRKGRSGQARLSVLVILGRIRGTLKREPLLYPLLALLNRDLIQRVYIPKGPPNPIP